MKKRERTKNSVDTAIVLGVVGDLGILSEDYLASGSDHTQLRDIDFYHCTLGQYTQLCIHRGLRVLLDAEYLQLERRLEVGYGAGSEPR